MLDDVRERPNAKSSGAQDRVVWDRAVRAFHWLLVASVATVLITGFLDQHSLFDVHVIAGTMIAVLVALRLLWGFTGSRYARFASFVCAPRTVVSHVRALLRGTASHHVGHNPVGAVMILALLAVLAALTATGVIVLGGVGKEGPLAFVTSYAAGQTAKEVHELLAFGLLGLIALHVLGVVVESLRTRENLVRAMVTGRKDVPASAAEDPGPKARPWLALTIGAGGLSLAAATVWSLAARPALDVPTAPLDAAYVKECGACHTPHHPSVAPAATWAGVMRGLDAHFGENASLDAPVLARLTTYLTTNASERFDTKAANRLRRLSTTEPLRITATRGWVRLHRHLPDAAFKNSSVGGKLNCSKCHRDAETGRFARRAIAIPQSKEVQ